MKTLIVVITALTLTGCASGCREACLFGFGPGNPAFDRIGLAMDRSDPCQTGAGNPARAEQLQRPVGYERPGFCGAGKGSPRRTVMDKYGNTVGYVQ